MQYLVDENGVVLEEIKEGQTFTIVSPSDKIIKGETIEYLKGTISLNYRFVKINIEVFEELYKYASEIWLILPYIRYTSGVLTYSNGRIIRPRGLSGILKKKRRNGSSVIKILCDLDVIHKHKDGRTYYYTFNPYIACKSKRITQTLYEEFKNTKYKKDDWKF